MSDMDDPREILKMAGVECPEVEDYEFSVKDMDEYSRYREITGLADAAILALARLVAKYQWQLDSICARASTGTWYAQMPWTSKEEMLADLDRRWGARNARPDA